ncbi:MAG TPA: hypothetical protein EYP21_10155 [Syntrophaceae bacterium]|nr:hypothetical protein [Syntrophaceae bacterium]
METVFLKPKRSNLTDSYGKFIVQPLERGFGTTLGNVVRPLAATGAQRVPKAVNLPHLGRLRVNPRNIGRLSRYWMVKRRF